MQLWRGCRRGRPLDARVAGSVCASRFARSSSSRYVTCRRWSIDARPGRAPCRRPARTGRRSCSARVAIAAGDVELALPPRTAAADLATSSRSAAASRSSSTRSGAVDAADPAVQRRQPHLHEDARDAHLAVGRRCRSGPWIAPVMIAVMISVTRRTMSAFSVCGGAERPHHRRGDVGIARAATGSSGRARR